MAGKKAVVSYKPTPAEIESNSPSCASSYDFWQKLVTEDCFTYSLLGSGTGQVHRTNYVQVADKTTRRQQLADKTRRQLMSAYASILSKILQGNARENL